MRGSPSTRNNNLQLVAHGFPKDTSEVSVAGYLTQLAKNHNCQDRVHNVFCMTDPTSVGYIEFQTLASKNGFHKLMRDSPPRVPGGTPHQTVRFTENLTKAERRDMK
eukprot:1730522-Pyramimonas_sp.AAC.1